MLTSKKKENTKILLVSGRERPDIQALTAVDGNLEHFHKAASIKIAKKAEATVLENCEHSEDMELWISGERESWQKWDDFEKEWRKKLCKIIVKNIEK